MPFSDAIRVGASGAAGDFEIDSSLRFNDNDSPKLSRTFSSAGNRRTFTFSVWCKITISGNFSPFFSGTDGSNFFKMQVRDDTRIEINSYEGTDSIQLITTRRFRDPSAWYHFVVACDTTQGSSSDRVKLYINGTQETAFDTNTLPSQNHQTAINLAAAHEVGARSGSSAYFDGYITEANFIDGLQLTPSSFAETNTETGQWVPINTSGLTFGSNGFRLNFSDNSGTTATTLGKDLSGNGNNFTPNNFVTGDAVKDSPTNNFATLQMMATPFSSGASFAEGNLQLTTGSSGSARNLNRQAFAPILVNSGKWYAEFMQKGTDGYNFIGVGPYQVMISPTANNTRYAYLLTLNGEVYKRTAGSETNTTHGSSASQYDVIGVYLNMDAGTPVVYFSKNGQWADGSGNFDESSPTSAVTLGDSFLTTDTGGNDGFATFILSSANGPSNVQIHANFGQDSTFAGQISAGGNVDANGIGDFKYAVPTGAKALCSANLPDPTILLPNEHFDTLLWSGNATTSDRSITGLNFQPDWAWTKTRNHAYHHALFDAVRGPTNRLNSDQDYIENFTNGGYLASFDSNGITWDYGTGNEWWNESGKNYLSWNWNAGETDGATYRVVVVSDSGNKYRFRNSANTATFAESAATLDLAEGGTYTFDGSDSSMSGHPFVIGTAANGSVYSTGVTYQLDGVSVTYSAYTSGYSSATTRKLIITVPASAPQLYYWCSIHSGMGGAINTNSTLGSSNFDGTIQVTSKVNTTAGFCILTYPGVGSAGTIGHGLGVAPKVIITKRKSGGTEDWKVYHQNISGGYFLKLNATQVQTSNSDVYPNTAPTSTVYSVGNHPSVTASGSTYVAYVFSEVAGYSKFGSYVGNGDSENGAFVFTNHRPAWIMFKNINTATWWFIYDVKRETFNVMNTPLSANEDDQEYTDSHYEIDILSNGFKIRGQQPEINKSGDTIVYFSFAELPFKNSRAR